MPSSHDDDKGDDYSSVRKSEFGIDAFSSDNNVQAGMPGVADLFKGQALPANATEVAAPNRDAMLPTVMQPPAAREWEEIEECRT